MKPGSGNKKGSKFERDIAKKLSLWWTDGENDSVFWRTSSSGARATNRFKNDKQTKFQVGDLTLIDTVGKLFIEYFMIELKHGYSKEIDPLSLLDSKMSDPLLLKWWVKAKKEGEQQSKKETLIIFQRNHKEICIVLSQSFYTRLSWIGGGYRKDDKKQMVISCGEFDLVIVPIDQFLSWVSPETIKQFNYLDGNQEE